MALHLVCVMARVGRGAIPSKPRRARLLDYQKQRHLRTWRDRRKEVEAKDMDGFSPRCHRVGAVVTMKRFSSGSTVGGGGSGRR